MHIVKTNQVDDVFEAVKLMSDIQRDGGTDKRRKYLGSIDPVTAAQFRKESGYAIGTKAFAKYAKKRLNSDYAKFRA